MTTRDRGNQQADQQRHGDQDLHVFASRSGAAQQADRREQQGNQKRVAQQADDGHDVDAPQQIRKCDAGGQGRVVDQHLQYGAAQLAGDDLPRGERGDRQQFVRAVLAFAGQRAIGRKGHDQQHRHGEDHVVARQQHAAARRVIDGGHHRDDADQRPDQAGQQQQR